MIATVGLAPGLLRALTPAEQPDDLAELIDKHENVIEILRDHAIVVMSSQQESAEFQSALVELGAISPDARKRWETLITFLRKRRRFTPLDPAGVPALDALATSSDLLPAWKGRIELAALPAVQAVRLGVGRTQPSMTDEVSNVEIAKGNLLRRSRKMARYASLAKTGIAARGADRDEWLAAVMLPLVRRATAIDIVDRYLYTDLVWLRDKKPEGREPEHVAWLLHAIGQAGGPPKHVRLIAGIGERGMPRDTDAAARLVRAACPELGVGIADLLIVGAPWRPAKLPHDRHVSFDLGMAIEFPAGLSRFRRQSVEDEDGVSWTFRSTPAAYGKCRNERERILEAFDTRTVRY